MTAGAIDQRDYSANVPAAERKQSPEVRRRPGGRAAGVRAAVKAATFALLEEIGYERLQLTDVAERAGVNKTTVYRRWPSKVELIAELFAELAAEEVPTPDTGSLTRDLEAMLAEVSALLDVAAVRAALRASMTLAEDDTTARSALKRFWDHRFERGAIIVKRAVDRGELPADTDPRHFQEAVFGPLYLRKLIVGEPVDATFLEKLAGSCQTS